MSLHGVLQVKSQNEDLRYIIIKIAVISTVYSLTIAPGENITEGNCSGHSNHLLCNCLISNTTIDIHFLPGIHYLNFTKQSVCFLKNKTSISITGGTTGDTTIECIKPFNIVFINVQNVTISNIKMIGCGAVMNHDVNQTLNKLLNGFIYFGNGFRFAVIFYNARNVSISNFSMLKTLGFGIIAFNMMGEVSLSKLHINDTNDPECKNYIAELNLLCSGSGILFYFSDHGNLEAINTALLIDRSMAILRLSILHY